MKPGQRPLSHAIAIAAGLQAMHPDPTVNESGRMLNGCICETLIEIMGPAAAGELLEATISELSPVLEEQFGMKIISMASLNRQAASLTDELINKLRAGGL